MTSTEVQVPQTFEERLKTRIKDSMGDLLPDEDLAKMVQRGVQSVFFDRRTIKDGPYHTKEIPSVIDEIVKDLFKEKVRSEVARWIDENPDAVKDALASMLQEGAGVALIAAFGSLFNADMNNLQQRIEERIKSGYIR